MIKRGSNKIELDEKHSVPRRRGEAIIEYE